MKEREREREREKRLSERDQEIPSNFRVTQPVKGSSRKFDREDTSVLTSILFILTMQRGRNNFLKFMHPVVLARRVPLFFLFLHVAVSAS